jgi:prepilin-type N-terminal cleavage/methylation domain-containing protein
MGVNKKMQQRPLSQPFRARLRRRSRCGFTLMEALVALVIFGVITFALSMALSAALLAQSVSQRRQEENGTVRAVFDRITRDLQAAYASSNSSASLFMANSGQSGSPGMPSASGGLLTLSTLSHRIQADDPNATSPGSSAQTNMPGTPQSDMGLVQYSLDSQTGMLSRTVSTVPNLQLLTQTQSGPETVLATHVQALTLRFWDANAKSWREDWDYEQQNQSQSSSSGSGSSSPGNSSSSSSGGGAGDANLPGAVEVTLVIRKQDGSTATFTTVVPVIVPQPQTNPGSSKSSTSSPNSGAPNSQSQNPGG